MRRKEIQGNVRCLENIDFESERVHAWRAARGVDGLMKDEGNWGDKHPVI